jgi:hypothetical protein
LFKPQPEEEIPENVVGDLFFGFPGNICCSPET